MNPLPLLALASSLVRPAARRLARTVAGLALLVAALGLPAARAQIYVVDGSLNGGGGGVSAFAQGSNGNVLPDAIVTGAGTGFISPSATVANATHLYVLGNNFGEPPFVLKFSLPTAGNATPVSKTFLAPSAGILSFFTALAIDGSNLYVLDNGTGGAAVGAVEVYPLANLTANTSGSPLSATRTITGAATGLNRPNGVAVDGTSVYVANNLGNNVLVFALAATGNAAPTANITGAALNGPSSVAVDATTIYVLNFGSSRVTTYPTSANGNVAPSTTIGSTSLTNGAYYIGVDATTVYVGDQGDPFAVPVLPPAVRAFPKATNSTTATPSTTISGTTALNSINGFFVLAPPGTAAPNVTASGGSTAFTVGAGAVVADAALTLTAVPATLATATIQLTTNFQTAQDVLAFTNTSSTTFGNIAGTYNATLHRVFTKGKSGRGRRRRHGGRDPRPCER
jgi:large repetitive protein